jgi:hypothetical protein
MDGPLHKFWLLREDHQDYANYQDLVRQPDPQLQISHALVEYIEDTLRWIPTINPASKSNRHGYGLNLYGATIINTSGASRFRDVCLAWSQMFSYGPTQLVLTGRWTQMTGDDGTCGEGYYATVEVDRQWLVSAMTKLAEFGTRAITDDYYILHLGL